MTLPPKRRGFWMRRALDGFGGVSEAAYPDNSLGAPTWRDVDIVARTEAWWDALPPKTRLLMMGLFAFVEVSGPVLGPGASRFSRLPVDTRLRALQRLRRSRWRLPRLLGDSLKSATTMMYLSHADSLAYIGAYSVCEHPEDTFQMRVDAGALARMEAP